MDTKLHSATLSGTSRQVLEKNAEVIGLLKQASERLEELVKLASAADQAAHNEMTLNRAADEQRRQDLNDDYSKRYDSMLKENDARYGQLSRRHADARKEREDRISAVQDEVEQLEHVVQQSLAGSLPSRWEATKAWVANMLAKRTTK